MVLTLFLTTATPWFQEPPERNKHKKRSDNTPQNVGAQDSYLFHKSSGSDKGGRPVQRPEADHDQNRNYQSEQCRRNR
jgi:hypothetical protein